MSTNHLAALTEGISNLISQPMLKQVIAVSVALFFVVVFPWPLLLKLYLSLEK